MFTATVGNVKTQRPGIWDMLGRAKWFVELPSQTAGPRSLMKSHVRGCLLHRDAWAKNKDLEAYEAKWLYVDAMLKAR